MTSTPMRTVQMTMAILPKKSTKVPMELMAATRTALEAWECGRFKLESLSARNLPSGFSKKLAISVFYLAIA